MESGANPRAEDAIAARLVANHREFLRFLEPRIGNRALAEEILQTAFVRTLEKAGEIRDSESAVAWFYRLLRNAVVDHYRRTATEKRTLDAEPRSCLGPRENPRRAPQAAPATQSKAMRRHCSRRFALAAVSWR